MTGLWLGLSTMVGVFGLSISSLAVLFLDSMHTQGELSLADYLFRMAAIAGYAVCPLGGWALFAWRRYRAAALVGSWPILSMGAFFFSWAF